MLAKRLKAARNAKKWTQGELAKKVNTTKGTISNYENNHSTPSNEMLLLLASALDTSVDYLLGHTAEDNTRTVMGKEVDLSNLTENQRIVLDWAMSQEALSFNGDKEDLMKILDRLAVIFEYEKIQAENKNGKKS